MRSHRTMGLAMHQFNVIHLVLLITVSAGPALTAAAFLESELPLELVVTTPVELFDGSTKVQVQGRQAITAVFSRPVIALGSDFGKDGFGPADKVPFTIVCNGQSPVPGKARWATTYIARFDPDIDWPSDLSCSVQWNTQLTSYDGLKLSAPKVPSVALTTAPLAISVTDVKSELAAKATDGIWDATSGGTFPEVPPDGNITLQFSNNFDLALVQKGFSVLKDAGAGKFQVDNSLSASVQSCPEITSRPIPFFSSAIAPTTSSSGTCALVKLSGALATGTRYQLCLNQGIKYYQFSGPLAKQTCVDIEGLRPFDIPFDDFTDMTVQLRRWDLWLRHGLADGVRTRAFKSVISVRTDGNRKVPFTMTRPNKATLRLSVPNVQPKQKYWVQISASNDIKDAFGLPLQASRTNFTMDGVSSIFQGPQGIPNNMALFEPSNSSGSAKDWPFLAYGDDKTLKTAAYWTFTPDRLAKFLSSIAGVNNFVNLNTILGKPDFQLDRPTKAEFSVISFKLQSTGPWIVHTCCQEVSFPDQRLASAEWNIVQESNLQAAAIISSKTISLLITRIADAKPAGGVAVDLYTTTPIDGGQTNSVNGPFTATATKAGVATFDVSKLSGFGSSTQLHAVLKTKQGWTILPFVGGQAQDSSPSLTANLFLDRALVKPGETLKVAGYIRKPTPQGFVIPSAEEISSLGLKSAVSPGLTAGDDNSEPQEVPFKYDATFGRITLNGLALPADTKLRSYNVQLTTSTGVAVQGGGIDAIPMPRGIIGRPITFVPTSSGNSMLASEAFTVADPRPPTVDLTLTVPGWAPPAGKAAVKLEAVSYLGTSVAGSVISVVWKLNDFVGGANVTTDAKGAATANIDLATFTPKPVAGDIINVEATWIGPTRERIVKSDTITVANGPYTIRLDPSLGTNLPGVEFGIVATVTSLDTKEPVLGQTVVVSLIRNESAYGRLTCNAKSGSKDYSACRLKIPGIGNFILRGCIDQACSTDLIIGKNASRWDAETYSAFVNPQLLPDLENYTAGSVANLRFEHPFPAYGYGLAVWGSNLGKASKTFSVTKMGLNTLQVPLGPECVGTCTVSVVLNVARTRDSVAVPAVRTNKLFDPRAPHTVTMTVTLNVPEDRSLDVKLTAPAVLAPGETKNINVAVTKAGKSVANTQVTVLAVDKAILDLLPYPLKALATGFSLAAAAGFNLKNWDDSRVTRAIIDKAFKDQLAVLGADPWVLSGAPQVAPPSFDGPDPTPLEILNTSSFQLSPFPPGAGVFGPVIPTRFITRNGALPMLSGPNPASLRDKFSAVSAPAPPESSVAGDAPSSGAQPRLQTDFQTTPLYKVITVRTNGRGTVSFKAPSNLGEFVLRAYAAAGSDAKFGSTETSVIVRRRVSLTPSIPRFARIGDQLTAGVVVTVPGTAPATALKVTLQPDASGILTPGTASTKTVQLAGGEQSEVRFALTAAKVGKAQLTFSVSGPDNVVADSVVLTLEVASKQEGVVVATSFAIRPNGTAAAWKEGVALPAAIPEISSLDLTAGLGNLPAVKAMFENLKKNKPERPYAYWSVSVALYDAVLAAYSTTPSSNDTSIIAAAVQEVVKLTNGNLGLLPYQPGTFGFIPTRCDTSLNAWAIWLVNSFPGASKQLKDQVPTWQSALKRQLASDAENERASRPPQPYSDLFTLAWARLALGRKVDFSDKEPIKSDLSFARLTDNVTDLPSEAQYLVALTLLGDAETQGDANIKTITNSILSNIRVAARTAYVASGPGSPSAAGDSAQALALLVLVKAKINNQLVPKVASYVASGPRSFAGPIAIYRSESTVGVIFNSLSTYDVAAGNGKPDLKLVATVGTKQLLSTAFNTTFVGPVSTSTPWTAIPNSASLEFQATGTGEASVAALLSFTAATVPTTPNYRGIWVQRSIQLISSTNQQPTGAALAGVPVGSTVAITIQVTTPDDLDDVTLRVLMPAGLEPIDPNVFSDATAQLTCSLGDDAFSSISSVWLWWWWPRCPSQETTPQAVTFRYQRLTAGASTVRFIAVAATQGTFLFPPTKAFATQQPEVLGLTAGTTFTVCDKCAPVAAPATATIQSCPADCSGNGNCDLAAGVCSCDPLFTGKDCAQSISV